MWQLKQWGAYWFSQASYKALWRDVIKSIVADRESVGDSWLEFLNGHGIRYYIRIRNNFKVELPHKNKTIKAWHLFNAHKANEFVYYPRIVRINGQPCYLSGCKLQPKKGAPDFLTIASFNIPSKALERYKDKVADGNVLQGHQVKWLWS